MNSYSFFFNPLWAIPESVIVWTIVMIVTARMSGWRLLAQNFSADEDIEGERFRFVSGSMGKKNLLRVRYSNSLFVTIGRKGLYISPLLPLRISHSPLLIPWSQLATVETKRQLGLFEYLEITFKDEWPILQIRGKATRKVLEAFNKYSKEASDPRSNWRDR